MISIIVAIYLTIGMLYGLFFVAVASYQWKDPELASKKNELDELLDKTTFAKKMKLICNFVFLWPIDIVKFVKYTRTKPNKRA